MPSRLTPLLILASCGLPADGGAPDVQPSLAMNISVPVDLGVAYPRLLRGGERTVIPVSTMRPNAKVWLLGSHTANGTYCPPALQGECFALSAPATVLAVTTTGPSGHGSFNVLTPVSIPDTPGYLQAVTRHQGGWSVSDVSAAHILQANTDADADGLSNHEEYLHRTNPLHADTDEDGADDFDEVMVYGTDPLYDDTDRDGLLDGDEVFTWLTDPLNWDSDGGGAPDGLEVEYDGTDPADAGDDVFAVVAAKTNSLTTGDMGGLAGADALCASDAAAAGHAGTWIAWLSTSTVQAIHRMVDHRVVTPGGEYVALGLFDLMDGDLGSRLNDVFIEPENALTRSHMVWTGTSSNGGVSGGDEATCADWTDQGITGTQGRSTFDHGGLWTQYGDLEACSEERKLYCFRVSLP